MQNKKLIILIILSIGAVISLIYGITAQPRRKSTVSTQQPAAIKEEVSAARIEKIIPAERSAKRSDYITWGRNPFSPVEAPVKVVTKLTLNGIMWDEERPLAIINDNVIGIGGKVGENRVVEIKRNSVILNDGISNFELNLH